MLEDIVLAIKTIQVNYDIASTKKRHYEKVSIDNELKYLYLIPSLSVKVKKHIRLLSKKMTVMNENKLHFLANKFNIDFKILSNNATKFYLSYEKLQKQRLIVKSMCIGDSIYHDPVEIGKHIHKIYYGVFNQTDPYTNSDLYKFEVLKVSSLLA